MKYLLGFILAATMGCSKNDLPKYSALGNLRILALVVDTPEIQNPGAGTTTVNLTPYLSDQNGTGAVSLDIQSCLDPGVAYGAAADCTNGQYASAVQTVSVAALAAQPVGTFGTPERTGAPSTGAIGVGLQIPAHFLAGYSSALQLNGVSYVITVTATSGSAVVKTFRRVLISTQTASTNPVLSDLLVGGNSLTSLPTGDAELSFAASTTPGSYQLMGGDGIIRTVAKVYQTTWFVSDGEILNPRTGLGETTTWTTAGAPGGRKTIVVGVLRDGRGGQSVLVRGF